MKTHPHPFARPERCRAFTLMEMILVLTIIAVLIGIGAATFRDVTGPTGRVAAQAQIESIKSAVQLYKLNNRRLPASIDALAKPPPVMEQKGIMDPWDRKYVYKSPGKDGKPYDIYSLGEDGKDGTEDAVYN
jgi:general secretion pathway protein G